MINNDHDERTYTVEKCMHGNENSTILASKDMNAETCCIKLEPKSRANQIFNEMRILPKLAECTGVPKLLHFGQTIYGEECFSIVTNVVGKQSLKDILKKRGYLSNKELFDIANGAIDILQNIHSKGFLYGDFKPEHFVFQNGKMYLVDYGSTISAEEETFPVFTPLYASLDMHSGCKVDERSDLESLWFVILSLSQPLPWATKTNLLEIISSKYQSLPENKKHEYPELSKLFLKKMNIETDSDEESGDSPGYILSS
uniref:Protein kinase domain-containing protein n=1 Tax=Arcella intermedia TaxID=1963864 RepID=A0A6B2LEM3_9EUKA